MEGYVRSDLASESALNVPEALLDVRERRVGRFTIQSLKISDEETARLVGKPCGRYLTLDCGRMTQIEGEDEALFVSLLAGELRGMSERLTGKHVDSDLRVLIFGLGNAELTADAIGPKTLSHITVTRHLREQERELYNAIGCCELSSLAPGVLGQTGIEALEILRGAIRAVVPDIVILIDALAARGCERLASTVQITDAGIVPGSGVGNHRSAITKESIGVPVIVIGVPTVVDSSTLVYDALRQAKIETVDESLRTVLENGKSFFVSPKDSDLITERASVLLARAIGSAFARPLHENGV